MTNRDVRQRGFAHRHTVANATGWLDAQARTLQAETIPLRSASGRVTACAIVSEVDVPMFDRSAMDGYAVVAESTIGASDDSPVELAVVGDSFPGRPSVASVESRTAVRIMTGAPVPAGCSAVIPVEHIRDVSSDSRRRIEVCAAVAEGRHIGRVGEDIRNGAEVVAAGRQLRPQDLGVLASIGLSNVSVVARPGIRILITGGEVAPVGTIRAAHQISDANGPMLSALVERDGGVVAEIVFTGDSQEQTRDGLLRDDADVVLVSGGSSVGVEDFAPVLLRECGELPIHGIAMRPSSPAGIGRIGERYVFLLPGNPVSCLCAYDFFAGRIVRQLGGRPAQWPYRRERLPLAEKIASVAGRTDYCRVRFHEGQVMPLAISGASILSSTTHADGFVVVPDELEGYAEGTAVDVWCYQ